MNYFHSLVSSPTSEESFQFGGYMPSAAGSGPGRSRGLSRPDTAPGSGRRSVRFADDLGLEDEASERPATAPSERGNEKPLRRGKRAEENLGGSFLGDSKKESVNLYKREFHGKGALLLFFFFFWVFPSFCSMAQHNTAQHNTAQHSTAQHSTAQYSTAQHSTAQHGIA